MLSKFVHAVHSMYPHTCNNKYRMQSCLPHSSYHLHALWCKIPSHTLAPVSAVITIHQHACISTGGHESWRSRNMIVPGTNAMAHAAQHFCDYSSACRTRSQAACASASGSWHCELGVSEAVAMTQSAGLNCAGSGSMVAVALP